MIRRRVFYAHWAAIAFVTGSLSFPANANAQTISFTAGQNEEDTIADDEELAVPGAVAQPAVPPGTPAAAVAGGAAETPRMTRLKQLTYDRRPSAILRAWAK